MTTPLKLYRASAGSGKTFTLAVEYIKLLIINQTEYRHILAVTFTNKATGEMKERILSTLYGLQHSLPDADDYLKVIRMDDAIKALNIPDEELRRRCGVALENITHDYSRFHIETIDSFFQSVLRTVAYELNLSPNLKVDLNNEDALSEAVDNILAEVTDQKTPLYSTLRDFVDSKTKDGGKWQIDDELKEFGKNIFKEDYAQHSEELRQNLPDFATVNKIVKDMNSITEEISKQTGELAGSFLKKCADAGYDCDSFKYGKTGVYGCVEKIKNAGEALPLTTRACSCIESATNWSKDKSICEFADRELKPILEKYAELQPGLQKMGNTASVIKKNIYQLYLLKAVDEKIRNLSAEADRFMLSDTAFFLQQMINDSNVPFIYEKSGTNYHHIMIDEFQDTSTIQWSNFLPLLQNALDAGNKCLIVGDVKQSIYRWRNGDWTILNNMTDNPYLSPLIDSRTLNINRRSLGNIIQFNNDFFDKVIDYVNEDYRTKHDGNDCVEMQRAYSDVKQDIMDKKRGRGYVHIENLNLKDQNMDKDEVMLARVVDLIRHLQSQGVQQDDITVLIRFNRTVPALAEYLKQHAPDINLISGEANQLCASCAINLLMLALRNIVEPRDKGNLCTLVSNYHTHILHTPLTVQETTSMMMMHVEEIEKYLPEDFVGNRDKLYMMPAVELVEHLYSLLGIIGIPDQDDYIFYFNDQLMNISRDKAMDINDLLACWNESLAKKAIPNSAGKGVHIMTIHKSKGLQFHTVILPEANWAIGVKDGSIFWCESKAEPFDKLCITPVNFNNTSKASYYAEDCDEETLRSNVDNINLLYVAFTRPKNNLFILTGDTNKKADKEDATDKPKSKGKSKRADSAEAKTVNVSNVYQLVTESIPSYMQHDTTDVLSSDAVTSALVGDVWRVGELIPSEKPAEEQCQAVGEEESEDKEPNVFLRKPKPLSVAFTTSDTLPEVIISNKAAEFIDPEAGDKNRFISKGLLYHNIFERINTFSDIDPAIEYMNQQGQFVSLHERDQVSRAIHKAFDNPTVKGWFQPEWQIINERAIFAIDPEDGTWHQHRPDRVIVNRNTGEAIVIDYKTGQAHGEYAGQLRRYMRHLTDMGYSSVKAYIWYILADRVSEVKPEQP